jgi:hypothetical protein
VSDELKVIRGMLSVESAVRGRLFRPGVSDIDAAVTFHPDKKHGEQQTQASRTDGSQSWPRATQCCSGHR